MKFMCWNCHGLGNPAKLRELKILLVANNSDIIFLSETKMTANDFCRVQNKCRMQNELAINLEGRSGGLVLMWRDRMNVSIQRYTKHHIDSMVKLESNKNMHVTGFYGHANQNLRSNSWDRLRKVGDSLKEYRIMKSDMQKLEKNTDLIIDSASREDSGKTLKETRRRLDFLYAREESYWAQRFWSKWLKERDRNTRYFHAKATRRLKKNNIQRLKDIEGNWVTNSKDISQVAKGYFVRLFRSNG
ncbi:hypothetical protein GOBAR_AA29995 [Gossypium barbadense]|uniref:Endonuclease/exonuclease/phosphatase domain-containing protein n=1 Tax=Gossypium barbadense TaxID=3634 RepID=A0A2P5WHX6_GOSBA|nr:hypothetical protein GOBAR_AA29995 [Gossypium barbadense]